MVEIAGLKRRYESAHVVLSPLPDVTSDVVKSETVRRVQVYRLSYIIYKLYICMQQRKHTNSREKYNTLQSFKKHLKTFLLQRSYSLAL